MVKQYIREALPTAFIFATMRLLARVCTNVYGQCASLNKTLDTAHMNAAIWSFVRMYSVMSLEVRFAVETLLRVQSAFVNWTYVEELKRHCQNSLTFGQPFGQEQVNGRAAGRPAEGSRSDVVAISVQNFR